MNIHKYVLAGFKLPEKRQLMSHVLPIIYVT